MCLQAELNPLDSSSGFYYLNNATSSAPSARLIVTILPFKLHTKDGPRWLQDGPKVPVCAEKFLYAGRSEGPRWP